MSKNINKEIPDDNREFTLPDYLEPRGTGIPDFSVRKIKRDGKICLYERSDGNYEVFLVKVQPQTSMFGKVYSERETYPSNEDFGNSAWCFSNKESALECYNIKIRFRDYK